MLDTPYADVDDMPMQTITLGRVETDAIAIRVAPDDVFRFLAEPRNLPTWAPGFAQEVRPDDDDWLVTSGAVELRIEMPTSAEHRTVDMVPVADRTVGAFMRVVPNGEGSECLFTMSFPAGTPDAAVADQMAAIATELETICSLLERATVEEKESVL